MKRIAKGNKVLSVILSCCLISSCSYRVYPGRREVQAKQAEEPVSFSLTLGQEAVIEITKAAVGLFAGGYLVLKLITAGTKLKQYKNIGIETDFGHEYTAEKETMTENLLLNTKETLTDVCNEEVWGRSLIRTYESPEKMQRDKHRLEERRRGQDLKRRIGRTAPSSAQPSDNDDAITSPKRKPRRKTKS